MGKYFVSVRKSLLINLFKVEKYWCLVGKQFGIVMPGHLWRV